MRFFLTTCLICILVATVGCVTNNWTSGPFSKTEGSAKGSELKESIDSFWNSKFGELSGSDQRAREIERRLGY